MSNETTRILTPIELHDIGARARRLSEINGVGTDAARILVLTEDIPRLLAHIETQQAEIEKLRSAKRISVWTNGKAVRKYTGQDKVKYPNHSAENGWRKYTALLVEEECE